MFDFTSWHRFAVPLLAATWLAACQTPPPEKAPAPYSGPVLSIQQAERGVEIWLPTSALFEVGQSSLNAQEVGPYLDRLAFLIKTKSDKAVLLEGHADNVGNPELNQKLSEDRAAEVRKGLAARGVPEQRIQTAGFAARRPVASNTTAEGRQLNRRVEVVLLDEKVENITRGEPTGAFASAWVQLKELIDQGVVKAVEK